MMKKIIAMMLIAVCALSFAGCKKDPTLTAEPAEDGKSMEITANKADPGDYLITGSIELGEGEQIYYDHQLDAGEIEIQFIAGAEEQSIDELPDMDGEPAMTLTLSEYGGGTSYFAAGSYMVKVTATGEEKAKGTITLEVKPVGSEDE